MSSNERKTNREAGENPAQTRYCERLPFAKLVLISGFTNESKQVKPLDESGKVRLRVGCRKPGDLPKSSDSA